MEFLLSSILVWIVTFSLFFYYYLTRNFNYWKNRNVVGPKPIPLFGNFKDIMLRKKNLPDFLKDIYEAYPNEPAIGVFSATNPILIPKDPRIIKDILIKSFINFSNRDSKINEIIDPLSQHLVFLEFKRWNPLRKALTPLFSLKKLKEMFCLIDECAEHLKNHLELLVAVDQPIDCSEITARYTTDAIAVCAFGLASNSLSDGKSKFREIGNRITSKRRIRYLSRILPNWIVWLLKPLFQDEKVTNFFTETLKNTMEYRKINGIHKNDVVDFLMDIKDHPEKIGEQEVTDAFLAAQAYVFFVGGFDTTSLTMAHILYELAINPDIQDKLREEINHENIADMKYFDKIFKETLRKYPPIHILTREATNDHTFNDFKFSIEKGTKILIPVHAIHHDPNIYPDPDTFDPERFDETKINSIQNIMYLPFGDGPKYCIGDRFAYYQVKLGLAVVLKNFKFEICEKTDIPYEKRKDGVMLGPENALYLKIIKIKHP